MTDGEKYEPQWDDVSSQALGYKLCIGVEWLYGFRAGYWLGGSIICVGHSAVFRQNESVARRSPKLLILIKEQHNSSLYLIVTHVMCDTPLLLTNRDIVEKTVPLHAWANHNCCNCVIT